MSATESYSCVICLDTSPSYSPTTTLPCDHIFHRDCIGQWQPNPCPICRIEIFDIDYTFPEYTPPVAIDIVEIPKGTTVPLSGIDINLVKSLTGYVEIDKVSKDDLVLEQNYLFNSDDCGTSLYVGNLVKIDPDSIELDNCIVIKRRREDTFNICYTCTPQKQKLSYTDNYYLYKLG